MTYPISDVTRRIVYSGSAGTGPYSFSFEILLQGDIAVYFNDTLLTITTDYTVTINADGTGSVTLVTGSGVPSTPTSSDLVVILGNKGIQRQTDFVTGGDLFATSLNDELDAQTIFAQQNAEAITRAIKIPPQSSLSIDTTLPVPQANYILGWNDDGTAILNLQEIGSYQGTDATTTTANYNNRDIVKDSSTSNVYICLQASAAGTLLTNTSYWALLVDAESAQDAQTAAEAAQTAAEAAQAAAETAETNAETAESNALSYKNDAETAKTAAEAAQAAAEAAADNFDDTYLGAKSSDPATDNDGGALNAGDLYFNTTSNVVKVYNGSSWQIAAINSAGLLQDTDIGVSVQAYDADTAKTDTTQNFTAPQRSADTVDNDGSFDLSAAQNFTCTPTGSITLTFTNIPDGQSGFILLVNTTPQTVALHANTKGDANLATTLSTAGTYLLSYYADGTNVYVVTSAAIA